MKSVDETDWSSDTIITTALAIAKKIEQAIAEASIGASYFKDAWSKATIPISKGWSYVYDEGEAPSELNLEPGDYLIAKVDIASEAAKMIGSNWVVVQVNLDGAVTSSINLTDGKIVIGAGGKSVRVSDISGVIKATNGTVELKVSEFTFSLTSPIFPSSEQAMTTDVSSITPIVRSIASFI